MNRHPFSYLEVLSFVVFISLGYWIGKSIVNFRTVPVEQNAPITTAGQIPSLPDGERILLLIGVDQIYSQQPKLVSLWLLTYYLNNQPIQLLPIYPGSDGSEKQFEHELLSTFSISHTNGAAHLNPDFLELLEENDYWLSGYLLLDAHATSRIIDMLGGISTEHKLRSGGEIMQALPDSAVQPQYALLHQTNLFGVACETLSQLPKQPDWSQLIGLIPDHIIMDLQPHRLLTEIRLLAAHTPFVRCEFPIQPGTP